MNSDVGISSTTIEVDELSPVKRAIYELRTLRSKVRELEGKQSDPIAIIGLGCRIPGQVSNAEAFWQMLRSGVEGVAEIPTDRWDVERYFDADPDAPGRIATRWGGFIPDVAQFDPDFFGISAREAESIDPQQRILMEVCWEALEHGAQAPSKLAGSSTGVFIGIGTNDYAQLQVQLNEPEQIDAYFAAGSVSHSVASGRIAYTLGLVGPTISVDTACSSSLVSLHLACQSLRSSECDMALAGGVNVILAPENTISLSKAHMMAADGRCKTFDADADGFVRAEGCGIVVIKRLSDALANRDNILAVIRGSAINQDGRTNGLTAPNGPSQEAVIREALRKSKIAPADVGYVEAHGTGTSLGDPIEVQALASALGAGRTEGNRLMIGSVKTNIGHLEAAAGIAGLIKVVLCLQHKEIPPHLHFKTPNPHIPWDDLALEVPTELTGWPVEEGRTRIAGVSAFGFSGTNAHIVLEEAPEEEAASAELERPRHLFCLSGTTDEALLELADRHASHLSEEASVVLSDACFTANAGRGHFSHRLCVQATSTADLREKLVDFVGGRETPGLGRGEIEDPDEPKVVFLFTGQGSQYVDMGRELYESQPTFRRCLDDCNQLLLPYLDRPLLSVMYPETGTSSLLDETAYTQPALFSFEYAFAELWRSWGVEPSAVVGHSLGEYVAACVAGVFSLEDGLKLVAERARLMQALPSGGEMAAVFAGASRVSEAIKPFGDNLSIASINGPEHVVISGVGSSVRDVLQKLESKGVLSHSLPVSHAFHSALMDPMLASFERVASEVTYSSPRLNLISNVTGQPASQDMTRPEYWCRHIREPVRFSRSMATLHEQGYGVFLEVGPQPTLLGMGRRCIPDTKLRWLPSISKDQPVWKHVLSTLSNLYLAGIDVDWNGFDNDYPRRRITLPTYPFQRKKYWLDRAETKGKTPISSNVWQHAVEAGDRQSRQIPVDLQLHTYASKWQCLNQFATEHMLRTLNAIGAFATPDEEYSIEEFTKRFDIPQTYRNLLSRWFERLTSEGILAQKGDRYVGRGLRKDSVDMLLNKMPEVLSDIPFVFEFIRHCGQLLHPILTGKESPLQTLFPQGSFETAENLYQNWGLSQYYSGIAANIIESVAKFRPAREQLRILEIGAGIGGTTNLAVPLIPNNDCETLYFFTDVSEVFISNAQQKYRDYSFVHYSLLDIDKSPLEQGFGRHDFDVVLAANVMHATRNIHEALDHVLTLLAPGALLVLCEATTNPTWFDISFGLIEGWQQIEDDVRRSSPLLNFSQWRELLGAHGFEEVRAFPQAGSPADILGQHVILARAPRSVAGHEYSESAGFQKETNSPESGSTENGSQKHNGLLSQLRGMSSGKTHEVLVELVREKLSKVLRRDRSKLIPKRQRLLDLGVDSLMAVELRNLLQTALGLTSTIPATIVFDYPTVDAIAGFLTKEVLLVETEKETQPMEIPDAFDDALRRKLEKTASEIEYLSDEELEQLVMKKLSQL